MDGLWVLFLISLVSGSRPVHGGSSGNGLTDLRSGALTCTCDSNNTSVFCGTPPACASGTVLDVCGCCDVCAKIKGENCGGVWHVLGQCADGLECKPKVDVITSVGAGGTFHNVLYPTGICVDPIEEKLKHSECFQALKTYADLLKNNVTVTRLNTNKNDTSKGNRDCIYKPECTPDGDYTPKQCDGCTGECWCVHRDGIEIPNTRGSGRLVHCVM